MLLAAQQKHRQVKTQQIFITKKSSETWTLHVHWTCLPPKKSPRYNRQVNRSDVGIAQLGVGWRESSDNNRGNQFSLHPQKDYLRTWKWLIFIGISFSRGYFRFHVTFQGWNWFDFVGNWILLVFLKVPTLKLTLHPWKLMAGWWNCLLRRGLFSRAMVLFFYPDFSRWWWFDRKTSELSELFDPKPAEAAEECGWSEGFFSFHNF